MANLRLPFVTLVTEEELVRDLITMFPPGKLCCSIELQEHRRLYLQ